MRQLSVPNALQVGALAVVVFLLAVAEAPALAGEGDSRMGGLSIGVQAVEHTFDAMRVGDVRPTQHSDFGGRVEIVYSPWSWLELTTSGYKGVSHFDFDTGSEKGRGRDSDWSVDIGPNVLLGRSKSVRAYVGGVFFYGEARSKTSISNPTWVPETTVVLQGPRTFMVGGAARLVGVVRVVEHLEGVVQLNAGVMQARAHARPSGVQYEWNGRSFSAAAGLRLVLFRREPS
jgi:hypothetical protein